MEHNDLDKLFRDMIHNDDSDLSKPEQDSKVEVWDQLDLPNKSKRVAFPFWKIAAAVLFLLLGGTSWMMINNINQQEEKYVKLEQEYLEIKNSLLAVEEKLNQTKPTVNNEKMNTAPTEAIAQINTSPTLQKEYIDRLVPVYDTIWIEKIIQPNENIKLVRDTVFIEVEAKSPAKWTSLENNPKSSEDSISKKKRPSKVEFVFGKKDLKKPEQKQSIFLFDSEVAEKPKKKKRKNRIFSIPNNN